MSAGRLDALDTRVERGVRRLGRATVGDRTGLALLFGALVLYGLYWRVDVFIVDTFVVADTLLALSRGSLAIDPVVFSPNGGATPGMYVVDGQLYGRNYGQAALALPALWLLRGLSLVVDPRVLVAGAWSFAVLGFTVQIGHLRGRRRPATLAGCCLALALFAGNVAAATPLPDWALPLLALQATTMLAAALVGVVVYRLIGSRYSRRVATFAGASAVLLGPVGFWATIPKRHALTALLALVAFALFVGSRDAATPRRARRLRAAAYLPVGLTAWMIALEGLVLLAALASVDVLTARSNGRRELALVAGGLVIGLLPFLATNFAIAGNPLVPPLMLPSYDGAEVAARTVAAGGEAAGGSTSAGSMTGSAGGSPRAPTGLPGAAVVAGLLGSVVEAAEAGLARLAGQLGAGVAALEPSRLYHVYVRSGHIPGVDYSSTGGQTVEMTILESAPLLAALAALPAAAVGRGVVPTSVPVLRRRLRDPVVAGDLFAVAYVALFSLAYLPRLPLHSMITVRYLVPTVPFLLYGVVRLRAVRESLTAAGDRLPRMAAAVLAALLAAALVAFGLADRSVGTLVQAAAVAQLAVAGLVAGWALAATRRDVDPRVGATVLALALAAMTAFLLLSGVEFFGHGRRFALPLAELLEEVTPIR